MSIIPFNYGNSEIRVIKDESGEPMWVAKDVCKILGLNNIAMTLRKLDADERGVTKIDSPSGMQEYNIINESGLYTLILRSNKPEAKPFKRWVTHEVLPSIRKNGNYMNSDMKEQLEKIIPKGGYLEENARGGIKSKLVRAYYREDKNSAHGKLLTRQHQLQKQLNGLFIEEIKFELEEIEAEILELAEGME